MMLRAFVLAVTVALTLSTSARSADLGDVELARAIFEKVAQIAQIQLGNIKKLDQEFSSKRLRSRDQKGQCEALTELGAVFFQEDWKLNELQALHGDFAPVLRPISDQLDATRAGYASLLEYCDPRSSYFQNTSILDGRLRSLTIDLRRTVDRLADVVSYWPGLDLTPEQTRGLLAAVQSGGYVVSILSRWNGDWDHRENLVILGEAHIKNSRLAEIGRKATQGYARLGVESAGEWISPDLSRKLDAVFSEFRALMGCSPSSENDPTSNSTIVQAKSAYRANDPHSVIDLERGLTLSASDQEELKKSEEMLDQALTSFEKIKELETTFLGRILAGIVKRQIETQMAEGSGAGIMAGEQFIVDRRNAVMASAASEASRAARTGTTLLIVGADHVQGLSQVLVDQYGYSRVVVPLVSSWSAEAVSQATLREQLCD